MLTGLLCVVVCIVWQCTELMCCTGHIHVHVIHARMYVLLYVHYIGCIYIIYCSAMSIIRLFGI